MKKLIKSILLVVMLMNMGLMIGTLTANAFGEAPECTVAPFSPACILTKVGKETKLPDFTKYNIHPNAPQNTQYQFQGSEAVVTPIYYAIDVFRFAISAIMMIYLIIMSIKLISGTTSEEAEKIKDQLIYMVIGLLLVQLAAVIVKQMFFGANGEAFTINENGDRVSQQFAENSAGQIRGVIGFIEMMLGAVAVLVIVIRGFALMISGGEEENMTTAKRHITYAVIGLVVIGLSEIITRTIIFPDSGGAMNLEEGKKLIVYVTNFVAGFVSIAAFLMLLYGGYKYVVSGVSGEEGEKIKKVFIGAIIGIVISLGAYAAVNTLVKVNPGPDTKQAQNEIQSQGNQAE